MVLQAVHQGTSGHRRDHGLDLATGNNVWLLPGERTFLSLSLAATDKANHGPSHLEFGFTKALHVIIAKKNKL